MAKTLTVKSVESIKPESARRELPDGAIRGLYLVIQPSGRKSWALRYRAPTTGKTVKLTIGPLAPTVDGFEPAPVVGTPQTLASARRLAANALADVAGGNDPAATRKAEKAVTRSGRYDMDAVLDDFIARHVRRKNKPRTIRENERIVNRYIRPEWTGRDVRKIAKRDVLALIDGIVAPHMANNVHAVVRRLFNWCVERDIIDASPALSVKAPTALVSRDRVLSDDELRLIWKSCDGLGPFGSLVKLLAMTGQRRDEISSMRWSELHDLDGENPTLHLPSERVKNRRAHVVPLAPQAVAIIEKLPKIANRRGQSIWVFTTSGEVASSGFSKAKAELDAAMMARARKEAEDRGDNPDHVEIPAWRLHDLRRTAASGMARFDVPPHVIEAVLNHKSGTISGVAAVYNRYDYSSEKRRSLDVWANELIRIVNR